MTALLEANGLALRGRLSATDLAMPAPGLIALVGPNGSGKTSLLHALAGIDAPEGKVLIAGIDPWAAPPAQRRKLVGYLPAARDIAWPMRASDVIALGGGEPGPAIEALELGGFAQRRVDRLSTGERSRVLLARALAQRPKLLLLDEPTANLDPLWQLRLLALLQDLPPRDGTGVIMALHDLDLAARFAERMLVIEGGRVVADGDARALADGPEVRSVFGIERGEEGWRPLSPREDRRSSP
jgi:iron complex transport system ATP-binding protein